SLHQPLDYLLRPRHPPAPHHWPRRGRQGSWHSASRTRRAPLVPVRSLSLVILRRQFQFIFHWFNQLKAWHSFTGDGHCLGKHAQRTHPPGIIAVQAAINHKLLQRFAVSGNLKNLIILTFVMAVNTRWQMHVNNPAGKNRRRYFSPLARKDEIPSRHTRGTTRNSRRDLFANMTGSLETSSQNYGLVSWRLLRELVVMLREVQTAPANKVRHLRHILSGLVIRAGLQRWKHAITCQETGPRL